jgi:hypothetical protein
MSIPIQIQVAIPMKRRLNLGVGGGYFAQTIKGRLEAGLVPGGGAPGAHALDEGGLVSLT